MVGVDLEELKNKIEETLGNRLQSSVVCSVEENEENEIVVSIEMDSFYYDEDKVELLRDLVKRLKELKYKVEGTERVFWTAETIKDLLTEEIIEEKEAYHSEPYYIFEIRVWVDVDKLDKFKDDIIKVINSLEVVNQ